MQPSLFGISMESMLLVDMFQGSNLDSSGLIGVAPSQEMLDEWNRRERALVDTDPDREPVEFTHRGCAVLGTLKGRDFDRVAKEGARTVPPRENGATVISKIYQKGLEFTSQFMLKEPNYL